MTQQPPDENRYEPLKESYQIPEFDSALEGNPIAEELKVLHIITAVFARHTVPRETAVRILRFVALMYGDKP